MATDKTPVKTELSRELTLFHLTMMGLGMMIGAGVFIGIGISIREAGPGGVILTFALNGLIALFTAMSFAELSSAIPRAGGVYNFARIAFGRGPSFLAGWMEWFASSVAGSLYAVVFATYTVKFFVDVGLLPGGEWMAGGERLLAVLVALLFIYINYRGAAETGKVGAFFTLGQTLFVAAIGVVGIVVAVVDPSRVRENFQPFLPHGWSILLATMGFIYVAFEGFEVIAQAGDEAIEPKRNIPKAMLYSVFIVTISYVAVSFATVVSVKKGTFGVEVPWDWIGSFGKTGFGVAVAKLMPNPFIGYLTVTLAVIFSSTSALNATIYSATRASYALGRDRMLPAVFSRISSRRRTPYVALLLTAVNVLFVAGMLPVEDVASSASIMFLFLFFLANLCVIKIRLNMGDELRYGYLMPLFPLFPILAVCAQGILAVHLVHMSKLAWVIAPSWIAGGCLVYLFYSRSRAITTADEILVFEEQRAPEIKGYRIMVSVANPANALELVRTTYKLGGVKDAHVELLHVVPVPPQVPLADADRYIQRGRESIMEAMLYLSPMFATSTTLRYCRNVARGIISAVREKKVDTLIMGWRGQTWKPAFRLGSTVDPVIERVPCNVILLKNCGGDRRFKRVLAPVAGGPNGAYAMEIASILADEKEGEVTVFSVRTKGRSFDLDQFVEANRFRLHRPRRVRTKQVECEDVLACILAEAESHDLLVIGCTREPIIRQFTRQPLPEAIARRCDKPLAMVKASGGIRSWVKRWI